MRTKMLTLVVCLALCLTLGGVYATWYYALGDDVADQHQHLSLSMGVAQNSGEYGSYNVDLTGFSMSVEPKGEESDEVHKTALVITGQIVLTFTPGLYSTTDVKDHAVATTWNLGTSINQETAWTYNGQRIFTVDTGARTIGAANSGVADKWVDQAGGTFTYTINAATIASMITMTEFDLDTKVDYDAFTTALGQGQIGITVSDGKSAGSGH